MNIEERRMRILIVGGDGFCGWPTALHLSARDYDVTIVDNLSRRAIERELGAESLTPISTLEERLVAWQELTDRTIAFERIDVAKDYNLLVALLRKVCPDAIIHFGEQRSAPYSMKSSWHKRYTIENNIAATNNILTALCETELDCHLVHLGTMGVYGYDSEIVIPEGYLTVSAEGMGGATVSREILFPCNPGSMYHLTKCQDQLLFAFYSKNDGIRITDLHQGVVWGTETAETALDERLINRFDYDGDFGTVLNRFLMQAVIGWPLSVHGTGGQTRAFIHISDTCRCIELALNTPPSSGEPVQIMNQMAEVHRVRDLATLVAAHTGAEIAYLPNPRNEAVENDLMVVNQSLLTLGLTPISLTLGLADETMNVARRYAHRCDRTKIAPNSYWSHARRQAADRSQRK